MGHSEIHCIAVLVSLVIAAADGDFTSTANAAADDNEDGVVIMMHCAIKMVSSLSPFPIYSCSNMYTVMLLSCLQSSSIFPSG